MIFFNVSNENVQGLNGSPTMNKKKKSVIEEKLLLHIIDYIKLWVLQVMLSFV